MDWNTHALALCAAALSLVASPAAAQDEPETLAPVTNWTLDYGENSCALSRVFGTEEDPVLFEMRQYAPATPFYATILSQRAMVAEPDIRLLYEGNTPSEDGVTVWMLDAGQGMRGFRTKLYTQAPLGEIPFAPENPERDRHEAGISYVDVTGAYPRTLRLDTGAMGPVFAAMRDCSFGLLEEWSLDVDAHRSLSEMARWDTQRSGFQRVYRRMSTEMREQFVRGNLPVRMMVDAEGRISSCEALTPYANAEHTSAFCDVAVDFMRYTPARDATGEPIATFAIEGVHQLRTQVISR